MSVNLRVKKRCIKAGKFYLGYVKSTVHACVERAKKVVQMELIFGKEAVGDAQKRFIYRLLARHDSLPVWLVADK